MKHLFLFFIIAMTAATAHAQLEVDSMGNICVNTSTDIKYKMNIHSNSNTMGTINVTRIPPTQQDPNYPWSVGLYSRADHTLDRYSFGVRAQATNANYLGAGLCFGVYGEACGATNGYNYGLYGVIGNELGAGVYGSTVYDMGQTLDQRYAGYFRGPVKVQGNLTVTGNISGVMLNAPSPLSGSSTTSVTRIVPQEQLANQLSSLDVSTFYHEIPTPAKKQAATSDTAEIEIPLTLMEEQVLSKQHYGLDAEQLGEVFPDLVYENEDGSKSINYVEMVPILVQAIKELSAKVEALKCGMDVKKSKKATGVSSAKDVQVLSLGQNKPNPFSMATDIEVTIPESVQHAFVYVYDLNGKKVQQVDITARGKQTVQLNAASLEEGMYLYSLIADGQVVQTRRMIVEK